jgi:hypothetical protein
MAEAAGFKAKAPEDIQRPVDEVVVATISVRHLRLDRSAWRNACGTRVLPPSNKVSPHLSSSLPSEEPTGNHRF